MAVLEREREGGGGGGIKCILEHKSVQVCENTREKIVTTTFNVQNR